MVGLFFDMLSMGVFYNQALVDVRSTSAGIKCLYRLCSDEYSLLALTYLAATILKRIPMHACMYVCMYVCIYVCRYVCMHACMYLRTHVAYISISNVAFPPTRHSTGK